MYRGIKMKYECMNVLLSSISIDVYKCRDVGMYECMIVGIYECRDVWICKSVSAWA